MRQSSKAPVVYFKCVDGGGGGGEAEEGKQGRRIENEKREKSLERKRDRFLLCHDVNLLQTNK